jgi:hypothetical protein
MTVITSAAAAERTPLWGSSSARQRWGGGAEPLGCQQEAVGMRVAAEIVALRDDRGESVGEAE